MNLAILTAQISHYHNARYIGAAKQFETVHVISSVNQADFKEFLSDSLGDYSIHKLFDGRMEYEAAAREMEVSRRTTQVLASLGPDAIAVAGWSAPESLAALEYGRENGIPVLVMSESQSDDANRSILREAVKRRVVSQFDAALVGGPSHAEYLVKLGLPRDRVHFGYNAIDNACFAEGAGLARTCQDKLRVRFSLPERYVLASARFIRKKNLPNLVRAYGDARRQNANLPDLVILGDGPERANVEDSIRSNGLHECVHLPGFRCYDVLPSYYALSECFLHVSSTEQWGLVINEAMACGVPVIASHMSGAARTVIRDGKTGLLTDIDVQSISSAILRLFDMTIEERSVIGLAGAHAIKDWGPEKFGTGLRAAVDCAAKVSRRGPIRPWDKALLHRLQRRVIDAVA